MGLSHIGTQGNAKMVDVSEKDVTKRIGVAEGFVKMQPESLLRIKEGGAKKGDVLAVATVAGIQGAKHTFEIIPMCHNINLSGCDIYYDYIGDDTLHITAEVVCAGQTGVEMEALTAVSTACLTVYDMLKAIDRGMEIKDIRLVKKSGGKSGEYIRGAK